MQAHPTNIQKQTPHKKPIFSLSFLMMQRVYRLSKEFEHTDEHADVPIEQRLFDGVPAADYDYYLNQFYAALGFDSSEDVPTSGAVRQRFQHWWLGLQGSAERTGYLTTLVDQLNNLFDPNGRLIWHWWEDMFVEDAKEDATIRELWAVDECCALVCGQPYSKIRSDILEAPYADYQHLTNKPNDLFSLNILEFTPEFFPEGHMDPEEPKLRTYRGVLISTTMEFLVDNIERALSERIDLIIKRGDGGNDCIYGYELCKNQNPIARLFLSFKGSDHDPQDCYEQDRQYKKFNHEGTSAYKIIAERTVILDETNLSTQELLEKLPERLHDQILEAMLESDLGL